MVLQFPTERINQHCQEHEAVIIQFPKRKATSREIVDGWMKSFGM